jgi:hypothetical protein
MNWSEYGTSEACACRVRPVPTKTNSVFRIFPEAQPSGSGYTPCPLSELASDISRTNRIDCAVANSPEIDFALVFSRTIDSIKNDPSQLRNTVYELAQTKLRHQVSGRGACYAHSEAANRK